MSLEYIIGDKSSDEFHISMDFYYEIVFSHKNKGVNIPVAIRLMDQSLCWDYWIPSYTLEVNKEKYLNSIYGVLQ